MQHKVQWINILFFFLILELAIQSSLNASLMPRTQISENSTSVTPPGGVSSGAAGSSSGIASSTTASVSSGKYKRYYNRTPKS